MRAESAVFMDRKIRTIDMHMDTSGMVFVVVRITSMQAVRIRMKKCPFTRMAVPLREVGGKKGEGRASIAVQLQFQPAKMVGQQ